MKKDTKKRFSKKHCDNAKNQADPRNWFCKILGCIKLKKLKNRIASGFQLNTKAKNILACIFSVIITCFAYLLVETRSPLSDVFTTKRISILKDRPENITRDIVVDMCFLSENGGMMTLTQALVNDIAKKRPNWRLLMLIPEGHKHQYDLADRDNIKLIEIKETISPFVFVEKVFNPPILGFFHDKLLQLLHFNKIFFDRDCDLIWDPLGDSSFCNFVTAPRISTIHDLACYDVVSEFFASENYRIKSKICINNAIDFSKKIITVSNFSQERICDKFHVSKDFVKHIPIKLGTRIYSDNDFEKRVEVLNKYGLDSQKYFIFCSTWWRNKNHSALIKAFNKFAQTKSEIKLILVGKHHGFFQSRPIKEFCSDRLIITGFVPDEELGILLKNALAFIHPSVYEGFGMPIIEAMTNGIPVACSNIASLPEIAGSAALLFDPFDVDSITQAMHRMVEDSELRKDLIQKGYEQAKKYSDREGMVDEYIRVMEEVMEDNDRKKVAKSK